MHSLRIHRVEALESRSLQSVVPAGLVDSIRVNPRSATAGTVVTMTFTEKNVSQHTITVDYGPQTDGFVVKQHATVIWESSSGIQPTFIARETLKPGQSFTTQATWNGRTNQDQNGLGSGETGPELSGKFIVTNDLAAGRVTAPITLSSPNHH